MSAAHRAPRADGDAPREPEATLPVTETDALAWISKQQSRSFEGRCEDSSADVTPEAPWSPALGRITAERRGGTLAVTACGQSLRGRL